MKEALKIMASSIQKPRIIRLILNHNIFVYSFYCNFLGIFQSFKCDFRTLEHKLRKHFVLKWKLSTNWNTFVRRAGRNTKNFFSKFSDYIACYHHIQEKKNAIKYNYLHKKFMAYLSTQCDSTSKSTWIYTDQIEVDFHL